MKNPNSLVVTVWLILMVFLSLIINDLFLLFILLSVSSLSYFIHPSNTWRIYMKYSLLTSIFIFVFNIILMGNGSVVFTFFFLSITRESIIFSISMILRFLTIISAFATFSTIVPLEDTIRILEKMKIPQKAIISLVLSIRFFPVLLEDSKNIMNSVKARGIRMKGKKLKNKIGERIPLLTSILVNSLERSIIIAEVLEIRGFPSPKRTAWKSISLNKIEKGIIIVFLSDLFISLIYLFLNFYYLGIISSLIPVLIFGGGEKYD